MTNEKYTGEFKFGGRDCKNIYPAIVDKALFLKVQEKLADAFIDAKSQLLKNKIETKMTEYEVLLSDLETQKAQLELERGYRITKKDLLAFIEELLKGDVNDKEYQKQIINHLVSQVFVSDEDTVVFFNLRGVKDIEKLTIDDAKDAVNSAKGVRTQTFPLHHKKRQAHMPVFFWLNLIKS